MAILLSNYWKIWVGYELNVLNLWKFWGCNRFLNKISTVESPSSSQYWSRKTLNRLNTMITQKCTVSWLAALIRPFTLTPYSKAFSYFANLLINVFWSMIQKTEFIQIMINDFTFKNLLQNWNFQQFNFSSESKME